METMGSRRQHDRPGPAEQQTGIAVGQADQLGLGAFAQHVVGVDDGLRGEHRPDARRPGEVRQQPVPWGGRLLPVGELFLRRRCGRGGGVFAQLRRDGPVDERQPEPLGESDGDDAAPAPYVAETVTNGWRADAGIRSL